MASSIGIRILPCMGNWLRFCSAFQPERKTNGIYFLRRKMNGIFEQQGENEAKFIDDLGTRKGREKGHQKIYYWSKKFKKIQKMFDVEIPTSLCPCCVSNSDPHLILLFWAFRVTVCTILYVSEMVKSLCQTEIRDSFTMCYGGGGVGGVNP